MRTENLSIVIESLDLSSLFAHFGYNSTISDVLSQPAWFVMQTTAVQAEIIDYACLQGGASGNVDQIFDFLKSDSSLPGITLERMKICSQAYALSVNPANLAAMNWFLGQNATIQSFAVRKICADWESIYPEAVVQSYSRIVVKSKITLPFDVIQEMDKCPPLSGYKFTLRCHYHYYVALCAFAFGLLAGFVVFTLYYVIPFDKWSVKLLCSPFNTAFSIALVALIVIDLMYITYIEALNSNIYTNNGRFWYTDAATGNSITIVTQLFQTVWGMSYLYFSYKRSENQLRTVFYKSHKLIRYAFLVSVLPIASPLPLAILNAIQPRSGFTNFNSNFQALSSFTLVLLDALFLYTFVEYLRRTYRDTSVVKAAAEAAVAGGSQSIHLGSTDSIVSNIDPKFLLICGYGAASVSCCLASSAVSLWLAVVNGSMEDRYQEVLIWIGFSIGLQHLVLVFMMCLKVGLFWRATRTFSKAPVMRAAAARGKVDDENENHQSKPTNTVLENIRNGDSYDHGNTQGRTTALSKPDSLDKNSSIVQYKSGSRSQTFAEHRMTWVAGSMDFDGYWLYVANYVNEEA
ncbi:hypothetical protein BDR26DRAFT_897108 [Obelidium mucronatum]|nr:hypothetical protein BDR26DRAFT_897108 [Obelidium mucronatum]